jgi:TrmH family RNA methyltransferase
LTDAWRSDDVQAISLPMRGRVDSLNVSAAAAVLFYEALRQRSSL